MGTGDFYGGTRDNLLLCYYCIFLEQMTNESESKSNGCGEEQIRLSFVWIYVHTTTSCNMRCLI